MEKYSLLVFGVLLSAASAVTVEDDLAVDLDMNNHLELRMVAELG